jgi:hypothetical protein
MSAAIAAVAASPSRSGAVLDRENPRSISCSTVTWRRSITDTSSTWQKAESSRNASCRTHVPAR